MSKDKVAFLMIMGAVAACGLFEPSALPPQIEELPPPQMELPPAIKCGTADVADTRIRQCPGDEQGNILEICSAQGRWVEAQSTCEKKCDPSKQGKVTFAQLKPVLSKHCVACHQSPERYDEYEPSRKHINDFIFRVNANTYEKMPPSGLEELTKEERQLFEDWRDDGLIEDDECNQNTNGVEPVTMTLDYIESRILEDLNNLDARGRNESAYLVLSHKVNAEPSDETMGQYRVSVNKTLNSVSTDNLLRRATVVDARESIYRVDLDAFDFLLSPKKRKRGRRKDDWDLVVDQANKLFKFESKTNKGQLIAQLSGRNQVWLHADNYIQAALSADTYYELIDAPKTLDELFIQQGVDIQKQFDDFEIIAGGGFGSPISIQKNRVVYRARTSEGSEVMWLTLDPNSQFEPDKNYFEFPCIFEMNCTTVLNFDASEVIYSLPNSMHAYWLNNAAGGREVEAPGDVVSNVNDPRGDSIINNANDCFRCHSKGFIPMRDQIRDHVLANASEFDFDDVRIIEATYKGDNALAASFQRDINNYSKAVEQIGVDIAKPDPINFILDDFLGDYTAKKVAAFVFISESELKSCINSSAQLKSQVGQLLSSGVISNSQFSQIFPILIEECSLNEDKIDR